MVVTIKPANKRDMNSFIMEAWKHGVEVQRMAGDMLEFTGYEDKINFVIEKYPATIIHKELSKIVRGDEL